MNKDSVIFKDDKWYCKKCDKEILKFERIQKVNTNKYKKGELVVLWKHKNDFDKRSCNKKGIRLSEKTKNNMSKSRKGKKLSQNTKNKISEKLKGKPKSEEAKKNMSKGQKGNIQSTKTKEKRRNTWKNKTPYDIQTIKLKELNTKKMNGTLTTSKPEKRSITEMLRVFSDDFIPHPTKDQLLKINPKLINYPGCSPDGFLISQNAFIEFQYHWSHGGHPYNNDYLKDRIQANYYKDKLNNGHTFYGKSYYTWIFHDPLKRKWCKENNFDLLEFWSEKEFNEYIKKLTFKT